VSRVVTAALHRGRNPASRKGDVSADHIAPLVGVVARDGILEREGGREAGG
jgi:hypothetical protein